MEFTMDVQLKALTTNSHRERLPHLDRCLILWNNVRTTGESWNPGRGHLPAATPWPEAEEERRVETPQHLPLRCSASRARLRQRPGREGWSQTRHGIENRHRLSSEEARERTRRRLAMFPESALKPTSWADASNCSASNFTDPTAAQILDWVLATGVPLVHGDRFQPPGDAWSTCFPQVRVSVGVKAT